ncbi:glycoside hydrolase superfamily [Lipomyces arxii]|uniref:glycoside hydrolase superfamily n=1 Tax=Lipomyces arxii TaxID=56418 RepID=UPI0034CD6193
MNKLINKLEKHHLKPSSGGSIPLSALPQAPPNQRDIYKYRFQTGVNLGGWFILEKWIAPSMHKFNKSDDDSEYAAVSGAVNVDGPEKAAAMWDHHYDSFVTEQDWKWLQDNHVNSVRVPLGFFCLGEEFTKGTPFSSVATVYKNAWKKYKAMIELAGRYKIGVLIDIHALPGGANPDSHSGIKGGGKFFQTSSHVSLGLKCVAFIAKEVQKIDNVIAIQIVNEASWDAPAESYYTNALKRVREIDPTQNVVISDAWNRGKYSDFVKDKPGMIVDTHVYKCFSDDDNKKRPQQLIKDIRDGEWFTSSIIIGEFSCVMSGNSWGNISEHDRAGLKREFGCAQINSFVQKSAGFYFWTYKFEEGPGGEWDFRQMVKENCLPLPKRMGKHVSNGDQECKEMLGGHVYYWDNNSKDKMEHWRYEEGFKTAWKDASAFYAFDESWIGQKETWRNARREQHVAHKKNSQYVWEFDQGFDAGLNRFMDQIR